MLTSGINHEEIVCSGKRLPGALSYLHPFATEAMMLQNNWQSIPGSTTTCLFKNLNRGDIYYCRIAAVGSKQQLVYSDVVNGIAA